MGYTVSSLYKKQTLDCILLQDFWEVHHRFEVCLFVTVQHLAVGDDFDVDCRFTIVQYQRNMS